MKSIGMTDKQMNINALWRRQLLFYVRVMGDDVHDAGAAALVGVKIYMENKLSYFTFYWPDSDYCRCNIIFIAY